ncbi:predicted protein [Coccidioides posadasii str. Silveira]|uniref:Predicted protein n=2 Tax=Coccidioides posadasii TaxID=199306 RepID=E9DBM4_COCPS|nr:predicted protein [Coccidioides posadasii str. Silveira]KMM67700.1 hypothetical protein CPAG_04034 [Coccidioides posadasii RMSCC 3488]
MWFLTPRNEGQMRAFYFIAPRCGSSLRSLSNRCRPPLDGTPPPPSPAVQLAALHGAPRKVAAWEPRWTTRAGMTSRVGSLVAASGLVRGSGVRDWFSSVLGSLGF